MPFPSTNLSKLPMLGTNPFPAKTSPTIGLPVTPDPAVASWKPSPSSTLDAEAAPKTDWWSIAMKVGAPLIGGVVGGKSGLRAGTQFATGVREQEAENTKLAQLAAEKKAKQDEIVQRREELKQKQAEIDAEKKADAERKRLADEEKKRQTKIQDMEGQLKTEKAARNIPEVERLTNEIDKLQGGKGESGAAVAKQFDSEVKQEEQDKKAAAAKRKTDAEWARISRKIQMDSAVYSKSQREGTPERQMQAARSRLNTINQDIVRITKLAEESRSTLSQAEKDLLGDEPTTDVELAAETALEGLRAEQEALKAKIGGGRRDFSEKLPEGVPRVSEMQKPVSSTLQQYARAAVGKKINPDTKQVFKTYAEAEAFFKKASGSK